MLIITAINLLISFKLILCQDDIIKMIEDSGYPAELHTVITEDDYVLGVHRIPMREPTTKVALLVHGIHCTAAEFIVTGRSSSLGGSTLALQIDGGGTRLRYVKGAPALGEKVFLKLVVGGNRKFEKISRQAYLLADHGYDVWIANSRGTEFSKNHRTLNASSSSSLNSSSTAYWNFSFHEMAKYDLPAIIDYILDMTNQSAVHYVGHSQGTTTVLAMLSMLPMYNDKIITLHLMCPTIFMRYTGIFYRTVSQFSDQFQGAVESTDTGEVFPVSAEFRKLMIYFCSKSSPSYQMCKDYMFGMVGPTFQWNDDLFIEAKILRHFPNSVSYKQLLHYAQIIKAGGTHFLQYDHKYVKNLELYNQTTPPSYPLSNVNAKIHFLYGTNDFMSSYLDVEALVRKFKSSTIGIDKMFGFNHADFLIGKDVNLVNRKILKLMNLYNGIPSED